MRLIPIIDRLLPMRRPLAALAFAALLAGCLGGCGGSAIETSTKGLPIVAAENFWGSIAAQLAGRKGVVQSIITNPAQDPHSYEPTAADARALATARLAIVNGVSYDQWASQLLQANPTPGRRVVNVGALLHLRTGENPHRWYDPADVEEVARAITADLVRLDPHNKSYFERQRARFERRGLGRYHALIASIRHRYGGVAVGASESIFALLAPSLGLRLITPYGFMKAVSEGTELTAQDIATAERQLSRRELKVWIYNAQNATPEVQRLTALARRRRIPVVTITETLSPATDSFEQWQVAQLERLARALRRATVR
jgi:zinc/manganese transport system substrate-binding protein